MSQVRLDLKSLNPTQKAALLNLLADGLTDNPNVPTPAVAPAAMRTKATLLLEKEKLVREAERAVTGAADTRDGVEEEADELLREAAADAEKKTDGDEVKLRTTNFTLRDEPAPVGTLTAPTAFRLTIGDAEGELDAQWDRERGMQLFEVQLQEATSTEWVTKATEVKSKTTIGDLPSGKRYRGRVRAKGAAGWSPWSEETGLKTAP